MPATYTPIATFTVTGSTSIIQFASIPQTYTDLRVVGFVRSQNGSAASDLIDFAINNVTTGGLYSTVALLGNTVSATTTRWGGVNVGYRPAIAPTSTTASNIFGSFVFDINDYSNTTTFKSLMSRYSHDANGSGGVGTTVVNYRSTAAVSNLQFFYDSGSLFTVGSRITLYGIAAA
jgi:hypothetical protein